MDRIEDPVQLTHPKFREFAYQAAWIATPAESANELADLLSDVPPEERVLPDFTTPWPWDFDSLVVALAVVNLTRTGAEGVREPTRLVSPVSSPERQPQRQT